MGYWEPLVILSSIHFLDDHLHSLEPLNRDAISPSEEDCRRERGRKEEEGGREGGREGGVKGEREGGKWEGEGREG